MAPASLVRFPWAIFVSSLREAMHRGQMDSHP
jgi:hypothetical protein